MREYTVALPAEVDKGDGTMIPFDFEGTVKIKASTKEENLEIINSLNVEINSENKIELKDSMKEKCDIILSIHKAVMKYLVAIDVTHKPTKAKITDPQDLVYSRKLDELEKVIFGFIMQGPQLGNG